MLVRRILYLLATISKDGDKIKKTLDRFAYEKSNLPCLESLEVGDVFAMK